MVCGLLPDEAVIVHRETRSGIGEIAERL